MKGVVPDYLLFKERKATYIFQPGHLLVVVRAREGCVTLSGATLSGEVARLFDKIATLNRQ